MTPKQLKLCDFIRAYTSKNRMAPTYVEMADHMGYKSIGNVNATLRRLKSQGDVTFTPMITRSVKVVEHG